MEFVVGTRYWGKTPQDLSRVKGLVEAFTQMGVARIFVAVNGVADSTGALECTWPEKVEVFNVTPWGKFVFPMNFLLARAGAFELPFLSISGEVTPTEEGVASLLAHLTETTLVVGAAMQGHDYSPGWQGEASGTQIPWNTFALWEWKKMSCLGFPLVGDAPWNPELAGVEEATAIAVAQKIWGKEGAQAILTQVPGVVWQTQWDDPSREAAHEKKMASKRSRPAAQLERMGIRPPFVVHI